MTKYICKCGRVVAKSTSADNTGNRDTAGCEGCPYLLPWGPMVWDDQQKGYTRDVKGYECRMSPTLEYASTYHGRADDKCSLHIVSLDLDFLDEVQAWIYDNAANTLSAGFSRGSMRGTDFCNRGRYSLSVTCAQNEAGMAAKAALLARFFGPGGHRLDMTPQQEKAHILAAIEAGKARAQRKDTAMKKMNDRCPLQQECERTCKVIGHERDCDYYVNNRYGTDGIPDQDEILEDEDRRLEMELEEKRFAAISMEQAEPIAYCNEYGTIFAVREHKGAPDLMCKAKEADTWALSGVLAAVKGEACTTADLREVLDEYARAHGWQKVALDEQEKADCPSANPTDAAPAFSADAGAATQSLSAADPASLAAESAQLAFDYSGLDPKTVDTLHVAEQMIFKARRDAHIQIAQAISFAHDALCGGVVQNLDNSKHGNRGDESFGCWCKSVGISRSAAYSYLNVASMFFNSTPEEQAALLNTGKSLLAEAAKPSAPAELVQAVKDGDITTHKQYQEAMAAIKERDAKIQELLEMSEAADRRADEAQAWAKKAEQEAALDRKEREDANAAAMRYKAECDRRAAEQQRVEGLLATRENQLRASQAEVARQKRIGMEMQEEVESRDERIRELEQSQTVVAGTADPEEIERRAQEIAQAQIAENDAKWAEITENQGRKLRELLANSGASQAVKTAAASVQTILDGLFQALSLEEDDVASQAALEDLEDLLFDWSDSIHNMLHPEDTFGYPPDDEEGDTDDET